MIFNILGDIATYLAVAVSLLYITCFFKERAAYRFFALYLLVVGIIQLWSYYIGRGGTHQNNLFLSHYYFGFQFVLLSLFYKTLLQKKWISWLIVPVLGVLAFQFLRDPELYYKFNPWGIVITTLPLVIYSTLFMLRAINDHRLPFTLVNASLLAYLLTMLIIFASSNVVIDLDISIETKRIINHINKVLYMIFLLVVVVEWVKNYNCISRRILPK